MGSKILLEDSIVPATKENFPALVHAWEYENYNFTTEIWTDSAGDCNLDLSSAGTVVDRGNGLAFGSGAGILIDSGTLSSFATNLLMLMTGKNSVTTTWGFELGDSLNSVGSGCYANDGTNGSVTWNGSNWVVMGNVAFSAVDQLNACLANVINLTDESSNAYSYDAGQSSVKTAAGTPTVPGTPNGALDLSANQQVQILANGTGRNGNVSNVYVLEFSDPSDLPSATEMNQIVSWMGINKRLYPGLKGRS